LERFTGIGFTPSFVSSSFCSVVGLVAMLTVFPLISSSVLAQRE
jgi:hypothetical protein